MRIIANVECECVADFPEYFVNRVGEIWSKNRPGGNRKHAKKDGEYSLLSPHIGKNGYPYVLFSRPGRKSMRYVHAVVLETFVGPKPDGEVCRHLDGCKTNNVLSNLTWGTYSENYSDSVSHGSSARFERHGRSKLKITQVKTIRSMLADGHSVIEIAKLFNVCERHIRSIRSGKFWRGVI